LNDAQRAEREYIRAKLARYRNSDWFSEPVFIEVRVHRTNRTPEGIKSIPAHEYIVLQDREVYDMLTRGVDVYETAAATHLTVLEVREIAARHDIKARD
jgi:hypothetical protein